MRRIPGIRSGSYGERLLEAYFPDVLPKPRDTYWTIEKDGRHETRVRRCGVCGDKQYRRVGERFGTCPNKARHP